MYHLNGFYQVDNVKDRVNIEFLYEAKSVVMFDLRVL